MPQMSYAQALTEAKQMIVQQQLRIKADADRIKSQQQTIVEQSSALVEHERKIREQAAELQRLAEDLKGTTQRLAEMTTAKEQADAVLDRQGQRLTNLQHTNADMERRIAEQDGRIAELASERDALLAQLPTREDEEALAAMSDLLAKRPAALRRSTDGAPSSSPAPMRLAEVVSEPDSPESPDHEARAEAA